VRFADPAGISSLLSEIEADEAVSTSKLEQNKGDTATVIYDLNNGMTHAKNDGNPEYILRNGGQAVRIPAREAAYPVYDTNTGQTRGFGATHAEKMPMYEQMERGREFDAHRRAGNAVYHSSSHLMDR
jgi:hypothetical protein